MLKPAQMFKKMQKIVDGFKNTIFETPEVEKLASERAVHCSECKHAIEGRFEVIEEKRIKELKGMICDLCLCPLTTKLRSTEEECPKKKW